MALIRNKLRMGDILKKEKIVTEEQILKALPIAKESHKKLGEVLVELGYTTEDAIASALSRQLGIDVISLTGITIEEDVLKLVNGGLLRKHLMIPFEFDENNINVVCVAMADPMDMIAIDDFSIITNCQVEPLIATPHDILLALDKYYGDSETMMAAQQYAKERELNKKEENEDYVEITNDDAITNGNESTLYVPMDEVNFSNRNTFIPVHFKIADDSLVDVDNRTYTLQYQDKNGQLIDQVIFQPNHKTVEGNSGEGFQISKEVGYYFNVPYEQVKNHGSVEYYLILNSSYLNSKNETITTTSRTKVTVLPMPLFNLN